MMHHLKVVSFDKDLNEKKNDIKNTTKKLKRRYDYTAKHKSVSIQKDTKTRRHKANNSTITERKIIKDDCNGFKAVNKISFTSMSELLKRHTNGKILKSFSSFKTISLDDIRRTLINNVYSHRRQKVNNQCLKNSTTKKNQKKHVKSQDDINVLYSFERSKSPDYGKGNYFVRKSSSDIFGIGSVRARYNTYLSFNTNRYTGKLPKPRRRKKKTESMPHILQPVYPICMPGRKLKKFRFQDSTSDHYNVVCFPRCSTINISRSSLGLDKVKKSNKDFGLRDRGVTPSPMAARIAPIDCAGDGANNAAVLTEPASKCDNCNKKLTIFPSKKPRKRVTLQFSFFRRCTICPRYLTGAAPHLDKMKECLKYTIIALSFIVWSPCILAIALCWVLVYPLKPYYILEDGKKTKQPGPSTFRRKYRIQSCFSEILEWTFKTTRRLALLVTELFNSLMNLEECIPGSKKSTSSQCSEISAPPANPAICPIPKNNSKWQPNPQKKYVLFNDDERGWLMKPMRNEVCEDLKRPKVVQNLCFNQKGVKFSDEMPEEEDEPNGHSSCVCLPKYFEDTFEESTQTRPPPFDPNDITFYNAEPEPHHHHYHKKRKQKKSSFASSRPCVVCPPIRICRPCPKLAHKSKSRDKRPTRKQPVKCHKCTPHPAMKYLKQARVCKRPHVRLPSRPAYRSEAQWQYGRSHQEKANLSIGQRFCNTCKSCAQSLKKAVTEADKTWETDISCKNLYINTLKKRPCFWIYKCCQSIYPTFLSIHRACCNVCYMCLLVLSVCVWCPIFFCCYLIYQLICGCCN